MVVKLLRQAARDELRHAKRCAVLAAHYGDPRPALKAPRTLPAIAPARLPPRERVLYELVAACCIAETVSVAVLTVLWNRGKGTELRRTLRELLKDEVTHSRIGWAHLAHARQTQDLSHVGGWLPGMLKGSVTDEFKTPKPAREDPALLQHGVLPQSMKRQVFEETLTEVIFPGLASVGVDVAPAQAWLTSPRA